jgi:hypothetical protein
MRAACQKQRAAALGCDPVQDRNVNVIKSGGQTPNWFRHNDLRVRNHDSEHIEIGTIRAVASCIDVSTELRSLLGRISVVYLMAKGAEKTQILPLTGIPEYQNFVDRVSTPGLSVQKNQSKSQTIISRSVLPLYLPNSTVLQDICLTPSAGASSVSFVLDDELK